MDAEKRNILDVFYAGSSIHSGLLVCNFLDKYRTWVLAEGELVAPETDGEIGIILEGGGFVELGQLGDAVPGVCCSEGGRMTIEGLPERWKAEEAVDHDGLVTGWLIEDRWFDTLHHITADALEKLDLNTLAAVTARGKDVEHITRITGYFSKTSAWNKGKTAELKDRARVKL